MDASVEALSAAMDGLSPPSQDTASCQSKCHLTALPNELQTRIYELVVFHRENNGIIALDQKQKGDAVKTMINGQAASGSIVRDPGPWGTRRKDLLDKVARDPDNNVQVVIVDSALDSTNTIACYRYPHFLTAHICSRKCSRQPAITRVSRQIRTDSLAIFYGVNRFHLELDTYNPLLAPDPVRWWWAIGDINLANIKRLCIAVMSPRDDAMSISRDNSGPKTRRRFDVLQQGASSYLTVTFGRQDKAISQSLDELRLEHTRSSTSNVLGLDSSARRDIVEYGYKIMESGLCVLAIERLLKAMDTEYDESKATPIPKDASAVALQRFEERYQFW